MKDNRGTLLLQYIVEELIRNYKLLDKKFNMPQKSDQTPSIKDFVSTLNKQSGNKKYTTTNHQTTK